MRFNYRTESLSNVVSCQTEMIQRAYSNFDPNVDYVLWLIPDLYCCTNTYKIDGVVEVYKKDGTQLNIQKPLVVRRPYINKCISQIGLKCGRRRTFGIPLVFSNLDELLELSEIVIRYTCYAPRWLDSDTVPLDMFINQLSIVYHINFDNVDENNHWYTLASYDVFYDEGKDCAVRKDHMKNYDVALLGVGDLVIGDNFTITDNFDIDKADITDDYGIIDVGDYFSIGDGRELTNREMNILDYLNHIPWDEATLKGVLKKETIRVKSEVNYYKYFYERTKSLQGAYYGDVLIEPAFGFKETNF